MALLHCYTFKHPPTHPATLFTTRGDEDVRAPVPVTLRHRSLHYWKIRARVGRVVKKGITDPVLSQTPRLYRQNGLHE